MNKTKIARARPMLGNTILKDTDNNGFTYLPEQYFIYHLIFYMTSKKLVCTNFVLWL